MRNEHELQKACIQLWDWKLAAKYGQPKQALFAIPNGGARNKITGAKLKAEGVRKGIPDLFLSVPSIPGWECYNGMYMELKVGRNKLSPEQLEFKDYCQKEDFYRFMIIRTVDEFEEAIHLHLDHWLNPENAIYEDVPGYADKWLRDRFKMIHGFEWSERERNGW